jgi:hypothetical protein
MPKQAAKQQTRCDHRTDDDIAQDIIELLDSDDPRGAIEVDVRATFQLLRALDQKRTNRGTKQRLPLWGFKQENREAIEELRKQIKNLQAVLKRLPSVVLPLLFNLEQDGSTSQIPSHAEQQRILDRVRRYCGANAHLYNRCTQLLATEPGAHKNIKHRQRWAAEQAWLMLHRTGKKPVGGTETSLFGKVTGLLYEAMTGKCDVDLERTCKGVLHNPPSFDGPRSGTYRIRQAQ